jgi:hypothetical protein
MMADPRSAPLPALAEIATTAEAVEAEALPRARFARAGPSDPSCGAPDCAEPGPRLPDALARVPLSEKSPAQWAYERVILYIRDFEAGLDSAHEVAMGFTGAAAGVMRIDGIGYYDPDIVTFSGLDGDGLRSQLIQHVSQLNVVLTAFPKPDPEAEPMRIGFRLVRALDGDAAADARQRDAGARAAPKRRRRAAAAGQKAAGPD